MNEWMNLYPSLTPACDPGVLWNEWIWEESQAHLLGLTVSVAGQGTCWSPRWSQETPSVERSMESSVSTSGHRRETGLPKGPGTHLSEGRLARAGTLLAPRGPCVRSSLSGLVEQWWFFFSHLNLSGNCSLTYLRSWGSWVATTLWAECVLYQNPMWNS